jgi:hypothetical protein
MSVRGWVWVLGFLAVGLAASALPWDEPTRQLAPMALLIVVCVIGLAAELAALAWARRANEARPLIPEGARPADGRVELVSIAGCRTEPNPRDPRLSRFVAIEAIDAVSPVPPRSPTEALLGRVAILSLFLGKDGHAWTEAEIAQAHKSLLRAAEWIEKEAMRWRAPVNLAVAATYFAVDDETSDDVEIAFQSEGDHEGPLEAGATTKALAAFSRAAARLGFADSAELVAQIDARVEADAWVWLLHPRCEGRSLAVPERATALPGVTLAVCYAREASFPQPLTGPPYADSVTYVHELLHLFNATDKYGVPLRAYPGGQVTERDVMYLRYEQLARLRIDPLTAAEIGWAPAPAR